MDERLMSGLSVIDDTCHQMAKQKNGTHGSHVSYP